MANINQYALYNQNMAAGDTYTAPSYIGQSNVQAPLQGYNQLCLFVKGATSTLKAVLQVAYVPCNIQQQPAPTDADFIDYATYAADTVAAIPTLNGLWYRFHIINTGATAAITCHLGN